ncbi:hypothetical protein UlMin_039684 [Ulmus minor]
MKKKERKTTTKKKNGQVASEVSWSDLPLELLQLVADNLAAETEISRFRSVCRSWRFSIPPFSKPFALPTMVPYLGPILNWNYLTLVGSTVYHLSPTACVAGDWSIASSSSSPSVSMGWIVKLREVGDRKFTVLNPLSPLPIDFIPKSFPRGLNLLEFGIVELAKCYSIQFPDGKSFSNRVIVSPTGIVMMICNRVLWHQKLGAKDWDVIDDAVSQMSFEDIIFYKGKVCAVDEFGRAVEFDSSQNTIEIAPPIPGGPAGQRKYLVESNGELFLLEKYCSAIKMNNPYKLHGFRIFKLNQEEKLWVEAKSLDDWIIFLGEDTRYSLCARNLGLCRGNLIIFEDPCFTVFDLETAIFSHLAKHPNYTRMFYPPFTNLSK